MNAQIAVRIRVAFLNAATDLMTVLPEHTAAYVDPILGTVLSILALSVDTRGSQGQSAASSGQSGRDIRAKSLKLITQLMDRYPTANYEPYWEGLLGVLVRTFPNPKPQTLNPKP